MIKPYQPTVPAPPVKSWMQLFNAPITPVLNEIRGVLLGPTATPAPPPAQPHKKDKGKRRNSHRAAIQTL